MEPLLQVLARRRRRLGENSPARPWSLAQTTSAWPCKLISVPGSTQRNSTFALIGIPPSPARQGPASAMSMLTAAVVRLPDQDQQCLRFETYGLRQFNLSLFATGFDASRSAQTRAAVENAAGASLERLSVPGHARLQPRTMQAFAPAATGSPFEQHRHRPGGIDRRSRSATASHDQFQGVLLRMAPSRARCSSRRARLPASAGIVRPDVTPRQIVASATKYEPDASGKFTAIIQFSGY